MNARYLIIRRQCPFCRDFVKVVNKLNMRMSIEKRIKIVDAWELEELGIKSLPIVEKFEKDGLSEGFPFCYLEGILVENAPTPEQLEIALKNFLEDDLTY